MIALRVPDRLARPLKWLGYPSFALLVFLFALYQALPRDRIRDRIEGDVAAFLNVDVTSSDFGLTLLTGPGVSAGQVMLKSRPLLPGEKPQRWTADDVVVHFNLFRLLRGLPDLSFQGKVGKGTVEGKFHSIPDETVATVDASGVSISDLPFVSQPGGLPIEGLLDLKADVSAAKSLAAQSNGSLQITVSDAAVGDGKAKLVIPGNDPFLSQGLTLPKIQLGRLSGRATIDKGRATLREVRGHSKDLDVEVEGWVELRDPLYLSLLHLYIKVKPADALLKREPTLELMVNGAAGMARRPDGFLGFAVSGSVGMPQALPAKEAPPGLAPPASPPAHPGSAGVAAGLPSSGSPPVSNTVPPLPSPPPMRVGQPVPAYQPPMTPPSVVDVPVVVQPPPVAAAEAPPPPPSTAPMPTTPPPMPIQATTTRMGTSMRPPPIAEEPPAEPPRGSETGADTPIQ